ncbi:hypothetical protein GCM10027062_14420 [Nocardioides hungaricus]
MIAAALVLSHLDADFTLESPPELRELVASATTRFAQAASAAGS